MYLKSYFGHVIYYYIDIDIDKNNIFLSLDAALEPIIFEIFGF